jgi:hypothetical protein
MDDRIARMLHVVTNALKEANNEPVLPDWDQLDEENKEFSRESVVSILSGEVTTAEQEHNRWAASKMAAGWVYGPVRDNDRKIHPMLVGFHDLSAIQQAKDLVRFAIVFEMVRQHQES